MNQGIKNVYTLMLSKRIVSCKINKYDDTRYIVDFDMEMLVTSGKIVVNTKAAIHVNDSIKIEWFNLKQ